MPKKEETLQTYRLGGVLCEVYDNTMLQLLEHALDLDLYRVHGGKYKWKGAEGLLNSYHAIEYLVSMAGEDPEDITKKDFIENHLGGMLRCIFKSHKRAIEFRYPGTHPEYAEEAAELRGRVAEHFKGKDLNIGP